jgi:organic hydroperoxide reductase OsmC/OhrA
MKPQFPFHFEARTESAPGIQTTWLAECGEQSTQLAIPPEFEGPGGGFSPEDLFNQALTNCFVATFKVYAEHSKLDYERVIAVASLEVGLDENKKPVMKKISVRVRIVRPSNPDRALVLAKKATQSGFILNSVKTEREFDIQIA